MKLATFIQLSRPRFWSYLAGPFLLGYVAGMTSPQQIWQLSFWLGLGFFLLPANLFLYGVNDLFDQETDAHNSKKVTHEKRFNTRHSQTITWCLVAIASVAVLGASLTHWRIIITMLLFLGLSWAYSAPPLRFKAKPGCDSYSNLLYILPGVIGYLLHQPTIPPLWILIAGVVWTAAMHAYSAIPDIQPDQRAHVTTIAVKLGEPNTLVFVGLHWLWFSLLLIYQWGWVAIFSFIYPLVAFFQLFFPHAWPVKKSYWFFPLLNTLLGGIAVWGLVWQKW